MIRIGLVDDHTLFRQGMAALLKYYPDFEVVVNCESAELLLETLESVSVDIILLDLEMPGMGGIECIKQLTQRYSLLNSIVLSMHDEEQFIVHLMEIGAKGYLLKNAEPEEIERAIRSVSETGYYFSDMVSKVMLKGLVKKQNIVPKFKNEENLTSRELEILKMICQEKTTNEIAVELFISPRTVEGHRNALLLKTGARNTAGMVVYAIKNRLW